MAGLLFAEKVAGAALVQVAGADREARAEPIEAFQGFEPLARRARDLLFRIG